MNKRFIRRTSALSALTLAAMAGSNLAAFAESSAQSDSDSSSSSSSSSPADGIWTAPQYQVKSVGRKPAPNTLPPDIAPGQGSAAAAATAATAKSQANQAQAIENGGTSGAGSPGDPSYSVTTTTHRKKKTTEPVAEIPYDETAARAFSQAVSSAPQYVWLSPDRPSPATQYQFKQNRTLASVEQLSRFDTYIKDLSQSIQANLSVPQSAQLVETSNRKYSYLISFVIKNNGQITNISSEKQVGSLTAIQLSDDGENGQVVSAITRALRKASPVKVPPAGFAPWYMLLKYDVSTGNVLVTCLNAR